MKYKTIMVMVAIAAYSITGGGFVVNAWDNNRWHSSEVYMDTHLSNWMIPKIESLESNLTKSHVLFSNFDQRFQHADIMTKMPQMRFDTFSRMNERYLDAPKIDTFQSSRSVYTDSSLSNLTNDTYKPQTTFVPNIVCPNSNRFVNSFGQSVSSTSLRSLGDTYLKYNYLQYHKLPFVGIISCSVPYVTALPGEIAEWRTGKPFGSQEFLQGFSITSFSLGGSQVGGMLAGLGGAIVGGVAGHEFGKWTFSEINRSLKTDLGQRWGDSWGFSGAIAGGWIERARSHLDRGFESLTNRMFDFAGWNDVNIPSYNSSLNDFKTLNLDNWHNQIPTQQIYTPQQIHTFDYSFTNLQSPATVQHNYGLTHAVSLHNNFQLNNPYNPFNNPY